MNRWVLPWVLLVAACGGRNAGFTEVADGVRIRLHALGEGELTAQDGDSLRLVLRMAGEDAEPGSLLSTDRWFAAADLQRGAMAHVLARLQEGDSMSVIAAASQYPWDALAPPGFRPPLAKTTVHMECTLVELRTAAQIQEAEERFRAADPEGFEAALIEAYMRRSGLIWQQWGTSLLHHRISGVAMDTARVQAGDRVVVRWQGRRLEDAVVVDDTDRNGDAFHFRFGDQDQVIKGVETAVTLLRPGQEGEFILPSSMAFGSRGVAGMVEPWTPMVYRVSLVAVERGGAPL